MTPALTRLVQGPLALAFWLGLGGARTRCPGPDRVLTWHGVRRRDAGWLGRQLRFLKRCFDIVPLEALLRRGQGVRRRIALTFDDGLRNNVTVLYPLLRRLGLPATYFVCPGLAESGRWLWNQEARQRLRRVDAAGRLRLAAELGLRSGEVEDLVGAMKRLPLAERERVEARLRAATPAFWPTAEEREAFDIATWEELRSLDPALITIGSHTMTHAILDSLDAAQLEHELGGSRRLLEARLDRPVEGFAYPNGDYGAEALGCVRRHYDWAVSDDITPLLPGCDPHLLPRHTAPASVLRLAWRMHAPQTA